MNSNLEYNFTEDILEVLDSSQGIVDANSWVGIFLATASPIASMLVTLGSTPTVYEIFKEKTTKDRSVAPYLCMAISSGLWMLYGFFTLDYSVIIPFVARTFCALVFTIIFHIYCPKQNKKNLYLYYFFAAVVLGALSYFCFHYSYDHDLLTQNLGFVALGSHFIFLISPFTVLQHVFETKSVECLPFDMTVFVLLASMLWTFYGCLVTLDVPMTVSSGVGVFSSGFQLYCHYLYGNLGRSFCQLFCFCCPVRDKPADQWEDDSKSTYSERSSTGDLIEEIDITDEMTDLEADASSETNQEPATAALNTVILS